SLFLGEKREVALRAAHISRKDHLSSQVDCVVLFRDAVLLKAIRVVANVNSPKLWVVPLPTFVSEQLIRFTRPPTAGWILGNACRFCGAPHIENRIDQSPCGFDGITSVE